MDNKAHRPFAKVAIGAAYMIQNLFTPSAPQPAHANPPEGTGERKCFDVRPVGIANLNPRFGDKLSYTGPERKNNRDLKNTATLNYNAILPQFVDPSATFGKKYPLGLSIVVTDVNGTPAQAILSAPGEISFIGNDGNPVKGFVPPKQDITSSAGGLFVCSNHPKLAPAIEELRCPAGKTTYDISFSVVEASKALKKPAQEESKVQAVWLMTGLTAKCNQ